MKFNNVGIFFDRDGTLNTEVDFLRDPDELELIPGAAKAIREANELGIKAFVITNQSGIARGFLTIQDLEKVHNRLEKLLARHAARLDGIYFCPHHPEFGQPPFNIACDCRKPNTGMLRAAAAKFGLDLSQSFVVGDRYVDIKAGEDAGCTTLLVMTGYGATEKEECLATTRVDYVARDVYDAWKYIRRKLSHGTNHKPPLHARSKGISR